MSYATATLKFLGDPKKKPETPTSFASPKAEHDRLGSYSKGPSARPLMNCWTISSFAFLKSSREPSMRT